MTGKEYLKKQGFEDIELFSDKGPFERTELLSKTLEKYHKFLNEKEPNILS